MKAKEIRELIDFISQSGLEEVNIETQEFKIAVKKSMPAMPNDKVLAVAPSQPAPEQQAPTPASPTPDASQQEAPLQEADSNYIEIKSPMIGTFYRSPNPETGPFVNEGDQVKVGQTVCIIEAMKLFNEIESEVAGRIVKVLVDDTSPVEFDQPLYLVDPS